MATATLFDKQAQLLAQFDAAMAASDSLVAMRKEFQATGNRIAGDKGIASLFNNLVVSKSEKSATPN